MEKYNEWVQDIACSIPCSLDTPVNRDDEGEAITLLDTLADSREKEPLAIAEKQELRESSLQPLTVLRNGKTRIDLILL